MSQAAATKPAPTEHAPEFSNYVTLVEEGNIIQILEQQLENSLSLLRTISPDKARLPVRPRQMEREGTVGPSHRLGENLQLSRLMFCTKRPNSAARV